MFYKLIEEYSNIIKHYSVSDFRRYGSASSLVAKVEFIDDSVLYIKKYGTGKKKYVTDIISNPKRRKIRDRPIFYLQ